MLALAVLLATSSPAASAAAADEGDARPRALVLDLVGDAVSAQTRKSITGLVVVKLAKDPRLDVVSGQELKGLADLAADKQQAGCDDSCLAEIAGAMDAQLVVNGFVGKLGSLYVVNLSLFDAKKASAVGRCSVEANSVEELPGKLEPAIDEMLRGLPMPKPKKQRHARVDDVDDAGGAPPYLAMGLAGAGAVSVVAGAALAGYAAFLYGDAASGKTALDDAANGFSGDVDALAAAHSAYVQKRDAYNGAGVAAAWAGGAAVVVGAGLAVAGAALWVRE